VIEHDIPLIMGMADRIVAMADGHVIASGTPDVVRNTPAVIEAYLGGSIAAIERSGVAAGYEETAPTRTKERAVVETSV
jgi:ABC-type hemin transport system ATPase subunit